MGSPEGSVDRYPNEGPVHEVAIASPFAVGKYPVTYTQFAAFVADTGYDAETECWTFEDGEGAVRPGRSWRNPGFSTGGNEPVLCLSWDDAKAFVNWIAQKTGISLIGYSAKRSGNMPPLEVAPARYLTHAIFLATMSATSAFTAIRWTILRKSA